MIATGRKVMTFLFAVVVALVNCVLFISFVCFLACSQAKAAGQIFLRLLSAF